jgi:non-heme chloroperoxidase
MGFLNLLLAITFAQGPAVWRDPSPHRAQFVTVEPGVKLEVLDWGGSGRPAVLLACYLTAHVYDDFAPKLAAGYHVYGITRRGLGASDKPESGYTIQRSADDVLAVIDVLRLQRPVLIGNSCAGWTMTMLAGQHGDRLGGMVFLDAADDPTLKAADYNAPPVDTAHMPKSIKPPPKADYSSFEAYRIAQRRDHGVAFPESELRQLFEAKADGSMGRSLLSPRVREAITRGDPRKPDYARVRVPLLAIFRVPPEMPELERQFPPQNEEERRALQQERARGLAMVKKWEQDVLAGIPTARIVELADANLYMFLSNEADVLRELMTFASTP